MVPMFPQGVVRHRLFNQIFSLFPFVSKNTYMEPSKAKYSLVFLSFCVIVIEVFYFVIIFFETFVLLGCINSLSVVFRGIQC